MTRPHALIAGLAGIAVGWATDHPAVMILGFWLLLVWFAFDLHRLGREARRAREELGLYEQRERVGQ